MSEAETIGTGKSEDKEKFSFAKEEDGVKRTVKGEEVENGWMVTIEKEWEEKNPASGQSEWKYNTWKYISARDPREVLKDAKAGKPITNPSDATDILNSVAASQGMLIV